MTVGDDVVALGQTFGALLGSAAVSDEVMERGLQLRIAVVLFAAVVLDAELEIEPGVPALGMLSCGSDATKPDTD